MPVQQEDRINTLPSYRVLLGALGGKGGRYPLALYDRTESYKHRGIRTTLRNSGFLSKRQHRNSPRLYLRDDWRFRQKAPYQQKKPNSWKNWLQP